MSIDEGGSDGNNKEGEGGPSNAGTLHGRWIYADEGADEIHRQIREMLSESEEEIAEEWAIHDYDGFGNVQLTEYEDVSRVAELAALIAEHGGLFASLAAHFGGTSGIEDAQRYMEEGYCGAFDSLEEYAEQFVDECYSSEIEKLPEFIRYHIDYQGIARDLELNGDVFTIEHDHRVHVFCGNV
ncbi:MAG TPA: antirestriction protein ArdA [Tepidisphaeraceae bacterium]|nr:antirestriction protein ArdA [Tepidisphaeraceae bacterium]